MPGKKRSEEKTGGRKRSGDAGGHMAGLLGLGMYGGGGTKEARHRTSFLLRFVTFFRCRRR